MDNRVPLSATALAHGLGTCTISFGEHTDPRACQSVAPSGIRQLSLPVLVTLCRNEAGNDQRRETSCGAFGFEIFRRAICERDQRAWDAVLTQYHNLVLAWIHRHPVYAALNDDHDYWVNSAFERFWFAIGPARFVTFPSLAAVLRYLKLCAHSVLLDAHRAMHVAEVGPLTENGVLIDTESTERTVVDHLTRDELWTAIAALINDEREHLIAYSCFVLELKPRDVYVRHPERFAGVADVYAIKRNLLDRLRRNAYILEIRTSIDMNQ